MTSTPDEIKETHTAPEINHAKGQQVNSWINQVNAAVGKKKVLTNAWTAQHKRLADHLGINLSQTASPGPTTAPLTANETIGTVGLAMPTCPGVGRHRGCTTAIQAVAN